VPRTSGASGATGYYYTQNVVAGFFANGSTFPAMVTDTPVHDEQGNLVGIIGVSSDISERKALEAELERRASQDLLTGPPNRHALVERIGQALLRTRT